MMPIFSASFSNIYHPLQKRSTKTTYTISMKLFNSPLSSCEHKYQLAFNQLQAMKTLKLKIREVSNSPNPNFISIVNDSFQVHDSNPTPSAYHFLIKHLSHNHFHKHINLVLTHLEKLQSFDLSEKFFITLIKYYGNQGLLQEAVNIFYGIPKFQCTPSVRSLNSLLIILCKSEGGLLLVQEVLMKAFEMRIRLEMSSFQILIKALCEKGKVGYAVELLEGMLVEHYTADAKIYSLVLQHLCRSSRGSVAVNFLKATKKAVFFPTVSDYNNVIDVLVKENKVDTACSFLSKMKYEGTRPDISSYNIVLNGYLMNNDFKKVDELFDEILLIGLVPNVVTYSTYIEGLCKQGEVERGNRMVICMEKAGCMPDVLTLNVVINGYVNVGMVEKAKEVMDEMLRKGFDWNENTYENLIVGLIGRSESAEAFTLFVEMVKKGMFLKASTCVLLVCNLIDQKCESEAFQVVDGMISQSIYPDHVLWESLIGKYASDCKTTSVDLDVVMADSL